MNATCSTFIDSPIIKGRCANCGRTELAHRGLVNARHVLGRVNETFDRMPTFYESHAHALADAVEFFLAPLTTDITTATDDALAELPTLPTPGELCDLLTHQVEEIRALESAGEDIDRPDHLARARLVKLAGLATALAELLDQRLAKHAMPAPAVEKAKGKAGRTRKAPK